MKPNLRIIVLAFALVTGLTHVSAQTVQVLVNQKVAVLPATASNYVEDPFRYFNIQFVANNVGNEGLDVFIDMEFTCTANEFYLRTRANTAPAEPIHLVQGINAVGRDELLTQLRGRHESNYNLNNPLGSQLLPEGTYELCVTVYLWSDRLNPARVPISIGPCPSFDVCYSGSAPELVSPMSGAQMALNGAMVVTPNRRITFF